MTAILPAILVALTAALVFAAGWRMCAPQNAIAGGTGSLLLFLLHPSLLSGIQNSSPWDAIFAMLFVCAWLWMENWSLFMRSWVLAGIFAFGLWVGTSFVLWGLVALVPWVIFNRRPLEAVVSFLTVFLGGLLFFGLSWGLAWFVIPNLGRPLFTQWIRWGGMKWLPTVSLPWCVLVLGAVLDRLADMLRNRRADASIFTALLLVVTILFGSPVLGMAIVALSAPLIMQGLAKREFLFHRGVRWVVVVTGLMTMALAYGLHRNSWMATGLSILLVSIASRQIFSAKRLSWQLSGEAACVGAYVAEFVGTLLHLFTT